MPLTVHPTNLSSATLYAGLELLSTAVLVVDRRLQLMYANSAAENLFAFSRKAAAGQALSRLLMDDAAEDGLFARLHPLLRRDGGLGERGFSEADLAIATPSGQRLHCACVATPIEGERIVLELSPLDQQLKIAREEELVERQRRNGELVRHLAHEIKNPLGGIRGAAQLLERELPDAALTEYTQVIVQEADRLQSLVDRLLTPHRLPRIEPVNIHEVLERVRAVLAAEFSGRLDIDRDYDISLPEIQGDREQLIQVMLNIARNAAQAMEGRGTVLFKTRIARQVTIARERHRLALDVRIVDSGPGVPDELRETIFDPLVSGRAGGIGVGLSIAQTFVNRHGGVIEFDSVPGQTQFIVLLPIKTA